VEARTSRKGEEERRGACSPTMDNAAVAATSAVAAVALEARVRKEMREEIAALHEQVAQLKEEARQRVLAVGDNDEAVSGCLLRAAAAAEDMDAPPPRARHSVSTLKPSPLKHPTPRP